VQSAIVEYNNAAAGIKVLLASWDNRRQHVIFERQSSALMGNDVDQDVRTRNVTRTTSC